MVTEYSDTGSGGLRQSGVILKAGGQAGVLQRDFILDLEWT